VSTNPQGVLTRVILSEEDIRNKLRRMAFEILEAHPGQPLALVGIHTRGVILARRVEAILKEHVPSLNFGTIDIGLYRDDLDNLGVIPTIQGSDIPFNIEGAVIILFDDVLFTGRTTRAALNVLMDYGRPKQIEFAVLVDRGNRELPIQADYVGETLRTSKGEHIRVHLQDIDGDEGVIQEIGESE
jgi:pyrimidine operon attenuation protein/uracil phosphoribosyltransferase